jgi:hypothetical protein
MAGFARLDQAKTNVAGDDYQTAAAEPREKEYCFHFSVPSGRS